MTVAGVPTYFRQCAERWDRHAQSPHSGAVLRKVAAARADTFRFAADHVDERLDEERKVDEDQRCEGVNECTAKARYRIQSEGGSSWLTCARDARYWRNVEGYTVTALR